MEINENTGVAPAEYEEHELQMLDEHIDRYFGKYYEVYHEIYSPDIHVDILIIPPAEDRDYITLITQGMGARKMNVPKEYAESKLERAELYIKLPVDWDLKNTDKEENYWPIRLLKSLARLPIERDTWLGYGHSVDNGENYASDTDFCCSVLTANGDESDICRFSDDDEVNFYKVIPLFRDEVDYKIKYGADVLMRMLSAVATDVVDADRLSAVTVMDISDFHAGCIREKNLPVDEITGYNHMAIYLRWCIENDLTCSEFNQYLADVVDSVKKHDCRIDLREIIRDNFDGIMNVCLFNEEGIEFAMYYYNHYNDEHCYPEDVDDYALNYFGEEKYNSEEFQNEAYLFVPYDESYYNGMKKYIDRNYEEFKIEKFRSEMMDDFEQDF